MNLASRTLSPSIGKAQSNITPVTGPVLQRKCACGNHTIGGGECRECSKKKRLGLQTKLKVNEPGDLYEQEADRIADQVMATPAHNFLSGAPPHIQRLVSGQSNGQMNTAPASVNLALASPGRPLEPALRLEMEQRFGHDFSRVRVHSGAAAEQSARDMNAHAYTVGHDIAFGGGRFASGTQEEQRLLAHELTHVVQQGGGGASERVQRACGPAAIGSVTGCIGRSGDISSFGGSSANLFLFKINCDEFASGEESRLRQFAAGIAADDVLNIDGFASEEGNPIFNENLSCARVRAVWRVLAEEGIAVQPSLYMHGGTPGVRTMNRSAVITRIPATPTEPEKPKYVCGPDVTGQVSDVLTYTRALFGGWSRADKNAACDALVTPPEAAFAWDILDLHKNAWILQYRCSSPSSSCPIGETVPHNPVCATWGAKPPCGSTVQVGTECYYAGSANYVIFGAMCKLCADEFGGLEFSQDAMRFLVGLYKLGGLKGANVDTAKAWSTSGYQGWPSGGTPPKGDKSKCSPTCPTPYQGPAFRITWCPHENPYSECLSITEAIESIIEHVF